MATFSWDELDEDLRHVLQELDMEETPVPKRLWEAGIKTFVYLARNKYRIEENETNIRGNSRDQLLDVVRWYTDFKERKGSPVIKQDFTYDAFKGFRVRPKISNSTKEHVIQQVLGSPNSDSMKEIMEAVGVNQSDLEPSSRIINTMSQRLKVSCNFDYETLIKDSIEAISSQTETQFHVVGRTQSGKSSVKGVIRCIARFLKCPVFIITKGVAESHSLCKKLVFYAEGTELEGNIRTASGGHRSFSKHGAPLVMSDGGTLIAADTAAQVNILIQAVEQYLAGDPERIYILAVDECDSMYRTVGGRQKVEQAYRKLLRMKPALTVMISATIVPVLLYYKLVDDDTSEDASQEDAILPATIKMYQIEPGDDYIGVEQMKPLTIDGETLYLERAELKKDRGHVFSVPGENESFIPFTSDAVMEVYYDALRPGAILLDATCHLVSTENPASVFEKAEKVQGVMLRDKGWSVALIVFVGSGIF